MPHRAYYAHSADTCYRMLFGADLDQHEVGEGRGDGPALSRGSLRKVITALFKMVFLTGIPILLKCPYHVVRHAPRDGRVNHQVLSWEREWVHGRVIKLIRFFWK